MSTWQVALVREQGVEFGVILVRDYVLDNPSERADILSAWMRQLGRPVALVGDHRHRAYGRRDIVDWLATVHPSQLPWRRITIN